MTSSSSTPAEQLESVLQKELSADKIKVVDHSDGACAGAKLTVYLSSPLFSGQSLLERHRLVNDVVTRAGLFKQVIHALTIKAWTAEEWNNRQQQIPQ